MQDQIPITQVVGPLLTFHKYVSTGCIYIIQSTQHICSFGLDLSEVIYLIWPRKLLNQSMAAILEYEYINIMLKTGLPAAIPKQILRQVSVFALESQLKKERPCRAAGRPPTMWQGLAETE